METVGTEVVESEHVCIPLDGSGGNMGTSES